MRPLALICVLAVVAAAGCGGSSAPRSERFQATVRHADAAGTQIAWYERGRGPALVMLMGTGSTMSEWDPALLRLLARQHRLILFDYPGVGLSGRWQGRSFDSLADSTAALMDAVGLEHANVLGWSMGGFVAQRLAVDHRERVDHLILAGTNPGGSRAVLGTRQAQRIDSDPNPSDAEILGELYPPAQQAEGRRFLQRLITASRSGEIPADFKVAVKTTDRQVAAEDPWLRSDRNYRQLAGVDAPTLAAAGREDQVVPPVNLERIADRLGDAELRVLEGAHAFLFSDRDAFARAVEELIGS